MARYPGLLRRRSPADDRRSERGATITEYGLIMALVVVTSIGAISFLQDESGSYLEDTGSDVGTPRELAANLDPDLPVEPPWLTSPPPPPPPTFPLGTVLLAGEMSIVGQTDCFQADNPGVIGSTSSKQVCTAGPEQQVEGVGFGTEVAFRYTDLANDGLCLSIDPLDNTRVVLATCDGSTYQLFDFVDNGGSYTFTNQATGWCLDDDPLGAGPCDGTDEQKFTLT